MATVAQKFLFLAMLASSLPGRAQTAPPAIPIHDPVLTRQNGTYYLFGTGNGVTVWSSKDRQAWKPEPPVFAAPPAWAVRAVPGFKGHVWAPDISFANGQYSLFYSISTFGKNRSAIGLATTKTLDSKSPDYKWVDHGAVIESVPGRDMWNAIDPNLVRDDQGTPWLTFGSFWNGIKLVQLRPDLTGPAEPQQWRTLARRPHAAPADSLPGEEAIEGPFIFRRNGFYYLFVSFDYCCRGPQSTYKMMVGRARTVTGPYLDQAGMPMEKGGGTLVLQGDANWFGVGHNAVATFDSVDYLVFHGYDGHDNGRPKLRIEPLAWSADGWPRVAAAK
ncbi:MAG TPA: arabinan endo-1,5-alpha-L-arabinosidase [Hymenobacter sp.]|uniref:arabinan endo-1,5-alpha-L-arabinosidase n=1 Tax=Hymenobacter sp. TaxID=1898978 RepID=UPI002D7E95BA|nr:arabinan endo-1,5-alpha-L-arabinosidase [Hymenobacter sp.]HET9502384.1 arabinan endo-1,5-alpha-L-arabinosidase [Hymenobacter sp.]